MVKESEARILGIVIRELNYEIFKIPEDEENLNVSMNVGGTVFKYKENKNDFMFNIKIEVTEKNTEKNTEENTEEKVFVFTSLIQCKGECTEKYYESVFAHLHALIRPKVYDATSYFSCFQKPYFIPLMDFSDFKYEVIECDEEKSE